MNLLKSGKQLLEQTEQNVMIRKETFLFEDNCHEFRINKTIETARNDCNLCIKQMSSKTHSKSILHIDSYNMRKTDKIVFF